MFKLSHEKNQENQEKNELWLFNSNIYLQSLLSF